MFNQIYRNMCRICKIAVSNVVDKYTGTSAYLNVGKIDMVFLEKAYEFLEVFFCWVVMSTVWPYSLRNIRDELVQVLDELIKVVPETGDAN